MKTSNPTGASLVDIHDLRAQPTDGRPGSVVLSGCAFGAGVSKAVVFPGKQKSAKKISFLSGGNTFAGEGGVVVNEAALPETWTAGPLR